MEWIYRQRTLDGTPRGWEVNGRFRTFYADSEADALFLVAALNRMTEEDYRHVLVVEAA